jgi:hypothetical protein
MVYSGLAKQIHFCFELNKIFNCFCILHILSICTRSVPCKYSQYNKTDSCRIHTAKFCSKIITFFIFFVYYSICSDPVCVFSVYEQIQFMYSWYTYKVIPYISHMPLNNFKCLEEIIFLLSF